jgi:hypothetical protein
MLYQTQSKSQDNNQDPAPCSIQSFYLALSVRGTLSVTSASPLPPIILCQSHHHCFRDAKVKVELASQPTHRNTMNTGKALPLESETFKVWLYSSRTVQLIIAIAVLGLDISVVDEWNQDRLSFNSVLSSASSASSTSSTDSIKTLVGDTPFTSIVIYTTVLTIFAFFYDVAVPKIALIFYHLRAEIVLELFLMSFWITSFAGMASYVQQMSLIIGLLTQFAGGMLADQSAIDQAANSQRSYNMCIAIAILGAIVFVITLFSFTCLIAFAVHDAKGRVSRRTADPELANPQEGVDDPATIFDTPNTKNQS